MDGFFLINKEVGRLSTDIVNHFRKTYRVKTGHAGTLDPFASGLLVILIGNGTKLSSLIQSLEKEYYGIIRLGIVTDSYDRTGQLVRESSFRRIRVRDILDTMSRFVGEIEQTPPPFSAVKVKGARSYRLARRGVMIRKRPRKIMVYDFELIRFDPPYLQFRALVGKGCYIRALAFDLGEKLGCGATLWELKRTRIGKLRLEDAHSVDDNPPLQSIDRILEHLDRVDIDPEEMDLLLRGSEIEYEFDGPGIVYVTDGRRMLIGSYKNNCLRTKRVILG